MRKLYYPAGLSLLLSLFNLLPAPPLDGGAAAAALFSLWPGGERGERLARLLALLTAAALTGAGLWALRRGYGAAALIAGALLTVRAAAACGCAGCRPPEIPRRPGESRAFRRASARIPAPPRR